MKKKLLKIFVPVLVLILLATLIGPHILLAIVRQETPGQDYAYSDSFLTTYEAVRTHLQERSAALTAAGVEHIHHVHTIDEEDGLYVDALYLPSTGTQTNLIVLTTGVHGIEGYIGSVMLDVFFAEIYPSLDSADTGVLVVANVNPYGIFSFFKESGNIINLIDHTFIILRIGSR